MVVDSLGVRLTPNAADMREQTRAGKFFWLDIFGGSDLTRTELLGELALESSDVAWALRFGQSGRMYIGRDKLRAVTWMADPAGQLGEIHVLCSARSILTVWQGDAAALDDIRRQFGERVEGFENSRYAAAAILLQLLIGTLSHAIRSLDSSLDELRMRLDQDPHAADFSVLARRLQKLQTVMASFNRYSSAVRSAIVGIEGVPGMDACGAAEFNEYAEQVEDVEHQIYERRRWLSDIMHDNAMAIAQRQAEQINRLTLVSLIFLPVTAFSGFFGMNFNWMIGHIESRDAFLLFGVLLPILSVVVSVGYFRQRGLIQFKSGSHAAAPKADFADFNDLPWLNRRRLKPAETQTAAERDAAAVPPPTQTVNQVSA